MEITSMFTPSSMFTTYSSLAAFYTLSRQGYNQFVPHQVREYIATKIRQWLQKQPRLHPKDFTLVINEYEEGRGYENLFYKACEEYLVAKIRTKAIRLKGSRHNTKEPVTYKLTGGEEHVETFSTTELLWKFVRKNSKGEVDNTGDIRCFELTFDLSSKDEILENYIPSVVLKQYDVMMAMKEKIYLNSYDETYRSWKPITFDHPFTFDSLALEPELKQAVIDDLDRFLRRREFYKRVGRAWKRGYLLYGPPGTGKSSLIAAIANYLRFDIYDLQLSSVADDATLRRLMLSTKNKSILVIEDIDCTMGLSSMSRVLPPLEEAHPDDGEYSDDDDYSSDDQENHQQKVAEKPKSSTSQLSLSGLLNFVDGLWSTCGDERIIIFTTNHKDRLDPALLRPGRMDMHIHMSYLTMSAFKALARNYLGVSDEHALFGEIEQLLETKNVSPAEVAEALTRSEDVDIALSGVVEMLRGPKLEPSSNNTDNRKETIKKRKQPARASANLKTSKKRKKSTKAGSKSKGKE